MSLYGWIAGRGRTGFGFSSTAEEVTAGLDLSGRTYLVTGCSSGLGQETARVLALRGGRILGLARTEGKARDALERIPGAGHVAVACELSDPASVGAAAEAVLGVGVPLDALICNAGIMALPKLAQAHGYELQFFTNHIGHAILVHSLLDQLADSGRVVILSSEAHLQAPRVGIELDNLSGERRYGAWSAYGQSKLANLLFARALAQRLEGSARTANAVHPGVIATNLGRHLPAFMRPLFSLAGPVFLKTVPQGAATQCYVAAHPDAAEASGEYWSDCNVARSSRRGRDLELAGQLWEHTDRIIAEVTIGSAAR